MSTIENWRKRAGCGDQDPELFFPVAGERTPAGRAQYAQAATVCASCPVRTECLDYALDAGLDHGMFGGMTPKSRRDLIHRQNQIMAGTSV